MRIYIRIVDALSRAAGIVAMLLLAAAIIVVCEMIFMRYMLKASTIWQTEFVIYSLMAATFIGSPYVLLYRGHVGVDLLPNALGRRGRFVLDLIASGLSLAFCLILAWSSYGYFHEALVEGWRTDTVWHLPLWIPLFPLPLGMALLSLQYVAEIARPRPEPEEGA